MAIVTIDEEEMQESFLEQEQNLPLKNEYKVLARKYRPQNFAELIGQEVLVTTVKNAILSDRLHHAFILTGIRGIGKTTTARIVAKALNCNNLIDKFEPCAVCDSCVSIASDSHQDVIEIDAASNTGVDNMREVIESAMFKPLSGKYKVFIIDEVHMLSKSAFNALLKTLEEPPAHVKFIFATTEIRKIPITILSRCQRFDLKRVDNKELSEHLKHVCKKEDVLFDEESIRVIASAAKGSVRDALSILDQAIALTKSNITIDITRDMLGLSAFDNVLNLFNHIVLGDIKAALVGLKELYMLGADPILVLEDLSMLVHNITKLKIFENYQNQDFSDEEFAAYKALASKLGLVYLSRMWQMMQKGLADLSASHFPLEELEMMLIKLTLVALHGTPEDLLSKISANDQGVIGKNITVSQKPANADADDGNDLKKKSKSIAEFFTESGKAQSFSYSAFAQYILYQEEFALYHSIFNGTKFVALEHGQNNAEFSLIIQLAAEEFGNARKLLDTFCQNNIVEKVIVKISTANDSAGQQVQNMTLADQMQQQQKDRKESLMQDDIVQQVLSSFPHGSITDIKLKNK